MATAARCFSGRGKPREGTAVPFLSQSVPDLLVMVAIFESMLATRPVPVVGAAVFRLAVVGEQILTLAMVATAECDIRRR